MRRSQSAHPRPRARRRLPVPSTSPRRPRSSIRRHRPRPAPSLSFHPRSLRPPCRRRRSCRCLGLNRRHRARRPLPSPPRRCRRPLPPAGQRHGSSPPNPAGRRPRRRHPAWRPGRGHIPGHATGPRRDRTMMRKPLAWRWVMNPGGWRKHPLRGRLWSPSDPGRVSARERLTCVICRWIFKNGYRRSRFPCLPIPGSRRSASSSST